MRRHGLVGLVAALTLAGAAAISANASGPPNGGATRAEAICLSQGGTFFANSIFMVGPGPGFTCDFSHDFLTTLPDPASVLNQPSLKGVAARCSAAGGEYITFIKTFGTVVDYFVWGCDLR